MVKQPEKIAVQGTVHKITYHHPDTNYTVLRLDVENAPGVTVVGAVYPVSEGEEIKVFGFWKTHPRYGQQFQANHWEKVDPATLEGIEKYLGSGMIKGIGPTYARRLVDAFGLETLTILSQEPHRVLEVEGIGAARARGIMQAWEAQRGMQDIMVFLQGHGIGAVLALKIYRFYGLDTIRRVKDNPYALARDIYGVGFVLADRIAARLGISGDFPLRVQAGVLHVLKEFVDQGHCFVLFSALIRNAASLLRVGEGVIEDAVEKLAASGDVILEQTTSEERAHVYLADLYRAEQRVAEALHRLLSSPSVTLGGGRKSVPGSTAEPRELIGLTDLELIDQSFAILEEEQQEAVRQALQQKVLVITGGPGTGKTTLLNSLLALLRRAKFSFVLAAPTGRAAKRMAESAGEEAMTIHRLLEYNPHEGGFQRSEDRPLEADVVIIDEASMVDLALMDNLLSAIDRHSHLVLIGDVDQLPSVGPGSVLRDLIDSGMIPVVMLRRIFRQDRHSLIVANAHRILQGQSLVTQSDNSERDFILLARESEEEILQSLKELVKEKLPRTLNLAADEIAHAIQLLTPMHRGMLGTIQLNREMQSLLNPIGDSLQRGEILLRANDKVMQLRNNYDKGIYNGDLGRITDIDRKEGKVHVDFYDKTVEYNDDELDEISLAYATSIHKSQGSEYPVVVIPLHMSHYMMLHRSILYTAVTRGKKRVVLVGSRRALAMAIQNVRLERRYTGLKEKLAKL
ncbi:MAG TPA: ATP-dependent RecD-like DNA helicase [Candidatus Binatia bacterium]|nr:ATP-dependent RecD-like DNA helicase [Candidatus Binatia bacterium]